MTREQKMQMISDELHAFRAFLAPAMLDRLAYLKSRWIDEREYEDFAEYVTAASKIFEGSKYAFVSMNKNFQIVSRNVETGTRLELRVNFGSIKLSAKEAR